MNNFDIICVGDVVIDAFLSIHEASTHCRLSDCELCVRYGEKIPIDSCEFLLGGNACNVSVGLARLSYKSSLIAEIGDDEFSHKITNGLAKEAVDSIHIIHTKNAPSSFAIGINFKGERTLFVEHVTREHNFSFEGLSPKWVYLTSLGKEWEETYKKTLDFVKSNSLSIAFNPGTLQLEEVRQIIAECLKYTTVLFVNKEEAQRLLVFYGGISGSLDSAKMLEKLQSLGPKIVVVTDGKKGSYVVDEDHKQYCIDMFSGEPIEKTGAGDAYTSGFLSALLADQSVSEAMRWGSINSASVVQKVGAQPGLLRREEIEKVLNEHKDFQARELL